MRIGVVVSCYRQERFLARTVAAIEHALEGEDWQGVLEFAAPSDQPLPPRSERWRVISSFDPATGCPLRPLTPGAGRMLGFAACGGDWVLFADSDMELDVAWIRAILATAAREPGLAGLGGRIEEWFVDGPVERPGNHDMYGTGDRDRPVDYYGNVAFYRREALRAAGGYDVRLSSDEDFELGMRLRWLGFELRSLGMRAGRHWSAPRPSFPELSRRWRTGLCFGQGQVLRLYLGRRGFGTLLMRQRLYVVTLGLWALGLIALALWIGTGVPGLFACWGMLLLALLAFMTIRKRSPRLALLSLLTWTLNGLGMLVGLTRPPRAERPAVAGAPGPGGGEAAC
jgi:hypothetical protein